MILLLRFRQNVYYLFSFKQYRYFFLKFFRHFSKRYINREWSLTGIVLFRPINGESFETLTRHRWFNVELSNALQVAICTFWGGSKPILLSLHFRHHTSNAWFTTTFTSNLGKHDKEHHLKHSSSERDNRTSSRGSTCSSQNVVRCSTCINRW